MKLREAVQEAGRLRNDTVSFVKDCGDRWACFFEGDKDCIGTAPMFVYKSDGRCEYFFIGDYIDLLRAGKTIPLPK